MEPILVIMAAGMGSRYGGPKQIDPITEENDIIMDFSLYDAWKAGFRRVVFIIKRDFEETFRAHMDERAGRHFETHYCYQELTDLPEGYTVPEGRTKPWGTGHAVLAARDIIDAPFAVINADDYYGREGFEKLYRFLSKQATKEELCMVGFRIAKTLSEFGAVSRGLCLEENGFLTDIEEHTEVCREEDGIIRGTDSSGHRHEVADEGIVSMNLWGFGAPFLEVMKEKFPAALDAILAKNPMKGEFYLPQCVDEEIKAGRARVTVLPSEDQWFGITYREDREGVVCQFRRMKEEGFYPKNLWD